MFLSGNSHLPDFQSDPAFRERKCLQFPKFHAEAKTLSIVRNEHKTTHKIPHKIGNEELALKCCFYSDLANNRAVL
jgi:hypothetical protein